MSNPFELEVTCEDYLKDNRNLYAHKARRKKIVLIRVAAVNRDHDEIRVELGDARLRAGARVYAVESTGRIVRKFCEFTWDFVVYSILSFHPVLLVVDAFLFLSGPLYNRRLKRQLHLLTDGAMLLERGESKQAVIAFCGVPKGETRLEFSCCRVGGERREITCDIALGER